MENKMTDITNILPELYKLACKRGDVCTLSLTRNGALEALVIEDDANFSYLVTVNVAKCCVEYVVRDMDRSHGLVARCKCELGRMVDYLTLKELAVVVIEDIFD